MKTITKPFILIIIVVCMATSAFLAGNAKTTDMIHHEELDLINNAGYILDQHQEMFNPDGGIAILHTFTLKKLSQEFTPTMTPLKNIELPISKVGSCTGSLMISITNELTGVILTSMNISSEDISEFMIWQIFDLPDIQVVPHEIYHILVETESGGSYACGQVYSENGIDHYPQGRLWVYYDHGTSGYYWSLLETPPYDYEDIAFRTYSPWQDSSDMHIDEIQGGFGLKIVLSNPGEVKVQDIHWSIQVEGNGIGLILAGNQAEDIIDDLNPYQSITIKTSGLTGIGPILINIQVDEQSRQATAFMLGPLVLRIQD